MQTVLNHQFFENQGDSRRAWQQKLGGMLSRNEIDEISVRPVARSMSLYEWVRLVVGIVYAALIWALIVFGDATLRSRSTPPPPSAPAAADTSVRPVGAGAGQDTGRR
jgi:hypothetical protein